MIFQYGRRLVFARQIYATDSPRQSGVINLVTSSAARSIEKGLRIDQQCNSNTLAESLSSSLYSGGQLRIVMSFLMYFGEPIPPVLRLQSKFQPQAKSITQVVSE